MKIPKVSIIMSTYNETLNQLKLSVESILNQTFGDFEFIIINDNPLNQELQEFLAGYQVLDNRIKVVKNEVNIGLTASLNKALKIALGDYIARMDADDISMTDRLEQQVNFLNENKDIDLVGANCVFIDENDTELWSGESLPSDPIVIAKTLKYVNYFKHPSWMFRKEILDDVNEYREIKYAEDYDFLSRLISCNKKLANIDKTLIKYRVRNNGISQGNYLEQMKAARYVNYLYNQRKTNKIDDYSYDNMIAYLMCSEKEKKKNYKANKYFEKATLYKKSGKKVLAAGYLIVNSVLCKYSFERNLNILLYKILLKIN